MLGFYQCIVRDRRLFKTPRKSKPEALEELTGQTVCERFYVMARMGCPSKKKKILLIKSWLLITVPLNPDLYSGYNHLGQTLGTYFMKDGTMLYQLTARLGDP